MEEQELPTTLEVACKAKFLSFLQDCVNKKLRDLFPALQCLPGQLLMLTHQAHA